MSNDLCSKSVQISWITSLLSSSSSSSFNGTSSQYSHSLEFLMRKFCDDLMLLIGQQAIGANCTFAEMMMLWSQIAASWIADHFDTSTLCCAVLYYERSIATTFLELMMRTFEFNWWNDMSITIIIRVKLRTVIIQLTIWFNAAQKIVYQRFNGRK